MQNSIALCLLSCFVVVPIYDITTVQKFEVVVVIIIIIFSFVI